MNSQTHPPLLVVGAGPTGLVAALTLLQNGIPVCIIEKDPNPRIGQRGPGIWSRSLELFSVLNVPEVNDLARPVPLVRSYKPGTLESLNDYSMVPYIEPSSSTPFHIVKLMGQQLLDVILRRHLAKFSCAVEAGTELRSLEQSDDGVTAVLAKKNGISETFHTRWIIGADGAKGVVRKQLGLTFLGETRNDTFITGDISLKSPSLDREYWHRFGNFDIQGANLRPTDEVGEDGWQFMIIGKDLDTAKIMHNKESVFEAIASVIPEEITFNDLAWVSPFRAWRTSLVSVEYLFVHSPAGGQGLNSGVQDAFNLCWKIALVEKGLADKSLLETYSEERLPVISEMLEITTSILNQTMNAGITSVERTPKLSMLGINYRFSSIVLDEFRAPIEGKPINTYGVLDERYLEAGDRAPEAPKLLSIQPTDSYVATLFNVYRPWYHTILVFAPSPADATPILTALESCDKSVVRSAVILPSTAPTAHVASLADVVLLDQGGHAYSAYLVDAAEIKVFVIRPME